MPRPKSELTGMRSRTISARFTESQHAMFLQLGGGAWLRGVLVQEIAKRKSLGGDALGFLKGTERSKPQDAAKDVHQHLGVHVRRYGPSLNR